MTTPSIPGPTQIGGKNTDEIPIYTDIDKVPLSLLGQMSGHWRVMSDQKRRQHDVSTRQIVMGQIFTIVAVGAVSIMVDQNKESLFLVGSTLILYPSLVDLLVSNSAVLSASVHHDIDNHPKYKLWFIASAVFRAITVSTLAGGIVGSLAGLLGWWLFAASFVQTVQLALLSGLLTGVIGLPLIVGVTFMARWLKSNPDDVAPPVQNTIFSVLVLLVIGIASRILS